MVDPGAVVEVPTDGFSESFVKGDALAPAEFGFKARAVDGVAAVVAGAVFDVGDESAQARGIEAGFLGNELDETAEEADVLPLVLAAYVVGAAGLSGFHDHPDCLVVVLDVKPVADVAPVAVHGKGLALEHVEDHEGDEFFGELVRAVVVRAVRDGERKTVGVPVGLGEVVACCLAGRIGRAGVVGGLFGEVALLPQGAKDLVGAHVVEEHVVAQGAGGFRGGGFRAGALRGAGGGALRGGALPRGAGYIEEGVGAEDVGAHEGFGAEDGAVHVAFGGEVDDGVDAVLGEEALDEGAVADVALDEDVAGGGGGPGFACGFTGRGPRPIARLDVSEVFEVARIGQCIEVDDAPREVLAREEPMDEIRADEAGAAGDEDVRK